MAKRKIMQITAIPETEHFDPHVFALCDDGTVWVTFRRSADEDDSGWEGWYRIKDIPQDDD